MDSSVILDYVAGLDPRLAALTPSRGSRRLEALRAFCACADALPAFRAAPPEDGATASAIGD